MQKSAIRINGSGHSCGYKRNFYLLDLKSNVTGDKSSPVMDFCSYHRKNSYLPCLCGQPVPVVLVAVQVEGTQLQPEPQREMFISKLLDCSCSQSELRLIYTPALILCGSLDYF